MVEVEVHTYELINQFDVWGNACEGWEVNNQCSEGRLEITNDASDLDLIRALKQMGFFKKTLRRNMLTIDGDTDIIIFDQRKDGMPICHLSHVYDCRCRKEA